MMRTRLFFFALCCLLSVQIHAQQSLDWVAVFDGVNSGNYATDVFISDSGYVYTAGLYYDTVDFDPGPGVLELVVPGGNPNSDLFITKLDPNGDLEWVKTFTSVFWWEWPASVVVDDSGNVYACGWFYDPVDFDPGPGQFILGDSLSPAWQGFVLKLDPNGDFIWARQLGEGANLYTTHLEIDNAGNLYVSGVWNGFADFDPGSGTFFMSSTIGSTERDAFICKLNPSGNFEWARAIGGTDSDIIIHGLSLDPQGRPVAVGSFEDSADFDPGNGVAMHYGGTTGTTSGFALKLETNGNYDWSVNWPGTGSSPAYSVGANTSGDLYVHGNFSGTVDFNPNGGGNVATAQGNADDYVIKLTSAGAFQWMRQVEDVSCCSVNLFGLDHAGNTLTLNSTGYPTVTGHFSDTIDVDPDNSATLELIAGSGPLSSYVYQLDDAGNLEWGAAFGGNGTTATEGIHINASDRVVTCGRFGGTTDFDPGPGVTNIWSGNSGAFTQVLTSCAVFDTITVSACDSFPAPSGDTTWAVSGVFTDSLLSSSGCDSVLTINLTVFSTSSGSAQVTACDSFTTGSGMVFTSSGVYQDTLPNANGCDSIVTVNVTITNSTAATISLTGCGSITAPSGNQVWTSSGTYTDVIPNANGCDSVLTVNATVSFTTIGTISLSGCGSVTSPAGQVITSTGQYLDTLVNANGCDSLLTVNATILPAPTTLIVDTICEPPYVTPSGSVYELPGTYVETYTAQNGCDSTVTYQLEFGQVTFWVAISGQSLTVVAPQGSSYQWLDCNNNLAPVPGADSASLSVLQFQSFAVVVTQGLCSDTSECILTESLTIGEELDQNGLNVYPNPNNGRFAIELIGNQTAEIEVVNPLGQVVLRERMQVNRREMALDHSAAGTYWVRYRIDDTWRAVPMVVK